MRAPWLLALSSLSLLGSGCASSNPSTHETNLRPSESLVSSAGFERVLVVAIDAVPWSVVERLSDPSLGDDALFREIGTPIPMVGSFPSTTTVSFAGMLAPLGASSPPGYEARFYDREEGRLRGGGLISYGKIKFSWREFFDWKIDGTLRKAWGYSRPLKFAHTEVGALGEAFARSDASILYTYLSASDAIGHVNQPAQLEEMLRLLDDEVAALREQLPPFRVVVVSDHGMAGYEDEPLRNVRKEMVAAVERAGFHPAKKIQQPNDLVFVPFGLLSSAVAFTAAGRELDAARVLASVDGVSVCAAPDGEERWRVYSGNGSAWVERYREPLESDSTRSSSGLYYRYRTLYEDPLDYERVAAFAAEAAPSPPVGASEGSEPWLSAEAWLEATLDHLYPDALHRIATGFELVANPASVLCSIAAGHMYGPGFTEKTGEFTVGKLRYTHGSLDRGHTMGFLVTDHPVWNKVEAVAFDRTFEQFASWLEGNPSSRATTP